METEKTLPMIFLGSGPEALIFFIKAHRSAKYSSFLLHQPNSH